MKANRTYIDNLVNGLTTDKIKFIEGKGWHTDIRTKEITYNPQDILDINHISAKGLLLHEVGHCKYTTITPDTKLQKKYPKTMQNLYNLFEDVRIENELRNEYGDFATEALTNINAWGIKRTINNIKNITSKVNQTTLGLLASNATRQRFIDRNIENFTHNNASQLFDLLPIEVLAKIRELNYNSILEKITRSKNTAEVKQIVDDEVYPLLKEWIEQEPQTGNHNNASLNPMHNNDNDNNGNLNAKEMPPETTNIPSDQDLKHLLYPYVNTLSKKLNTILQEKKATKYVGNHKSGRLLSKNAYKVTTDSLRIFSRKNKPQAPDYEVTIILDESGSMKGKKHDLTYIASFLLNETCHKLGFKTNVIIYNDNAYSAPLSDYRDMTGGGNDDYRAFAEAEKILNPNKDNIIFMLTDGSICNDPRPIIAKLTKQGVIIIAIGIGLSNDYELKTYYPVSISVPEVELLPNVMISQLQKIIHR